MNYYPENTYEDRAAKIRVSGPIAMAYVPMQKFQNLYSAAEGYKVGTLFKELDLPFKGGKRQ
ncbi:MAG: spore coat associated protein CotJA [Firmicutes bacterium]|nr:spore coat associated protein CotJA [Bacillota bacterium]